MSPKYTIVTLPVPFSWFRECLMGSAIARARFLATGDLSVSGIKSPFQGSELAERICAEPDKPGGVFFGVSREVCEDV